MRLVDADKIEFVLPRTLTEEEKKTYGLVIKKAFENAPTIDAIPIEWLKQFVYTKPDVIEHLIVLWRRDQERGDEWWREEEESANDK